MRMSALLYQARVLAESDFDGMLHWDEAGRFFFVLAPETVAFSERLHYCRCLTSFMWS